MGLPLAVIILSIWTDRPVFHAHGVTEWIEGRGWIDRTKCGREIATYKPWLPSKHAVKFARPCKGCFPV